MRPQGRTVEQELDLLASQSHGVVSRAQLLHAGVTAAEIKGRLHSGALLREYRGVYRVGHRAPSLEARYVAAVRACGSGALLSGRAAGHLLGVLRGAAPAPEVLTPRERRIDGVKTRRCRRVDPRDVAVSRGIPVTTVPRTLVDLAAVLSLDELARAPATRPAFSTVSHRRRLRRYSTDGLEAAERQSCARSCEARFASLSAGSSAASSRGWKMRDSPCRRPTGRPEDAGSTAAGPRSD